MNLNLKDVSNKNDHISKKDVLNELKKIYPDRDVEKAQQYPEITDIFLRKYMFFGIGESKGKIKSMTFIFFKE